MSALPKSATGNVLMAKPERPKPMRNDPMPTGMAPGTVCQRVVFPDFAIRLIGLIGRIRLILKSLTRGNRPELRTRSNAKAKPRATEAAKTESSVLKLEACARKIWVCIHALLRKGRRTLASALAAYFAID